MHGLVVNPIGLKGGMALLWTQKDDLDIINFSQHHIHAKTNDPVGSKFLFKTDFYANLETSHRQESWELLTIISEYTKAPQCVLGDFNKITHQEEKYGGWLRPDKQVDDYRIFLDLMDYST